MRENLMNAKSTTPTSPSLARSSYAEIECGGLLRLRSIIGPRGPIPVCKSAWWAGVRSGRYPKPVKLGPRITAWRVEDIRTLIQSGLSG